MADFSRELEFFKNPKGRRVTIAGLGVFGGGLGAALYLSSLGCRVLVTDLKGEKALASSLAQLSGSPIEVVLGKHREKDFCDVDLIVASPAVPRDSFHLTAARKAGVFVTTEIRLFLARCPSRHLACITGSNGKSTTTSLAASMLEYSGHRVWVGGNIGVSLLSHLAEIQEDDRVVLELSSFQLDALNSACFSPRVAVVTNISPNHLDRHGTFDSYVDAKRTIVRHQCPEDIRILFSDDETLALFGPEGVEGGRVLPFTGRVGSGGGLRLDRERHVAVLEEESGVQDLFPLAGLKLLGEFNRLNMLAASGAAWQLGATCKGIAKAATAFPGVPHRLEDLGLVEGVSFYNDSVATTPESSMAAMTALAGTKLILIAGGYDKGVSLDGLVDTAMDHAAGVILLGATEERLRRGFSERLAGGDVSMSLFSAGTFEEACEESLRLAAPGGTVLLSPGCASYGMFENFVERGEAFRSFVLEARQRVSTGP